MDTSSDTESESKHIHQEKLISDQVDMTLTQCGLLPNQTNEVAKSYENQGNWNDVKNAWFKKRVSNRSTRESSQKILTVLSSRLKNAPTTLPNPQALPAVLEKCATPTDRAQVVYQYLIADDPLFRYVVNAYASRIVESQKSSLDFSNEKLRQILLSLQFNNGKSLEYAESTIRRWCEGFRSVMREISALGNQQTMGSPPALGEIPLLIAMGRSYENGREDWVESPTGLLYLLQPESRWDELFNRASNTTAWEFVELHSSLQLQPTGDTYDWI